MIKINQKVYREISYSRTYGWLKEQGEYLGYVWPVYEGQVVKEDPVFITEEQRDHLMELKRNFIESKKPLYWGHQE